jgi:hypothetical protein
MNKMKKYKIFRGKTLQEAINKLLENGYFPVTDLKEAQEWKRKNKYSYLIDLGIINQKGVDKPIKISECEDLKKLYNNSGRLLFISYNNDIFINNYLNSDGHFLGITENIN